MSDYADLVRSALATADIASKLSDNGAIVLERIARGGGAARWYHVNSSAELEQLIVALVPGSVVSFYFDRRIRYAIPEPGIVDLILQTAHRDGDAMVGRLAVGEIEIAVEYIAGPRDWAEFASTLRPGQAVFFGPFPARDNDGRNAVTVTLPDRDGVARRHPH